MLKKNDRVRHKDSKNNHLGVLTVFEVKNGFAICGYLDYDRLNLGPWTFSIDDLIKVDG